MHETRTPRGAPDRVRSAHALATPALRLALVFLAAALLTLPLGSTGSAADDWLPLHLFLAGTVVLAISGASLLLTITWAAAPAPSARVARAQRWAIAAGAAGVAAGRAADWPSSTVEHAVVGVAGVAFLAGIVTLAVLLVGTVRRGVERRYDVPVVWYVGALGAAVAAAAIGIAMATGNAGSLAGEPRSAHAALNLLGLVGLVVGGTFPFFVATVGRTKMARRATPARHGALLAWQVTALSATAGAYLAGNDGVATAGLVAYALGVGGIALLSPTPRAKAVTWAGPRLLGLYAGLAWWATAVVGLALSGNGIRGGWLLALVVAGYGQILWGSLAYLVPVVRGGGHERLRAGFDTTRSWTGLVAVNAVGVLAATGAERAAAIAVAVLVVDTLARHAAVGLHATPTSPEHARV